MEAAFFHRRRSGGIGITPLIDVVFILLLFFMLTSTFSHYQSLDLVVSSQGSASEPAAESVAPVVVLVGGGGQLSIESGVPVSLAAADLLEALSRESAQGRAVLLSAHEGASVQDMISAVEQVRASGVERLDIIASVDSRMRQSP